MTMTIFKKINPGRFIALGFATVIILGTLFLFLPISHNPEVDVSLIDAFFISTSAVCVTGLVTVDTADTFNTFGRVVIATLIQIGGLGIASVGVGVIILAGKRVSFKERMVVKEAMNLESVQGVVKIVKSVLFITIFFELIGTLLNFIVFSQDYPPLQALGISLFHSISAFNNAGFDLFGNMQSLIQYQDNVLLNITTIILIIFGGMGFYVIKEICHKRSFKKFTLHTKVVLTMTGLLLFVGTLLFKLTEDISWLGALFNSTTARTAGFSTHSFSEFSNATLFIFILFMFIGASPGSTGGGVKTTTAFTLFKSAYSMTTNQHCTAFKRKIPNVVTAKAFIISLLAVVLICFNTLLLSIFQPEFEFMSVFFEVVSAFGTVGLSTGITPELSLPSKLVIILTMYIGRLGPLTIATIWSFKPLANITYSEENITIG